MYGVRENEVVGYFDWKSIAGGGVLKPIHNTEGSRTMTRKKQKPAFAEAWLHPQLLYTQQGSVSLRCRSSVEHQYEDCTPAVTFANTVPTTFPAHVQTAQQEYLHHKNT